jgi:hypothetical protein
VGEANFSGFFTFHPPILDNLKIEFNTLERRARVA